MNRLIFLDAGLLGLLSMPTPTSLSTRCREWANNLLSTSDVLVVPEIADYKVRRELLRADRARSLQRLDALKTELLYQAITTEAILRAASLWAHVRQQGRPTASDQALDGDVILAAQSLVTGETHRRDVIVATTNVRHLSRFVAADTWSNISAG